jgi:ABC-2 type transport system permease protein
MMTWAAIRVLWGRDLVRFFRQRSRLTGAFLQPIILWVVIASGLSGTFSFPGLDGLDYREYFFPGVVIMMVLFTAIFATMSMIEDRHEGFLQAALAGPGSRVSIAIGKILGGASIGLLQCAVFMALAPLAGFSLAGVAWPALVAALVLSALGVTAIGVVLAWWTDSTAGYHALMSILLLPAWFASGAMFPLPAVEGFAGILLRLNPMVYMVDATRSALYGGVMPEAMSARMATPLVTWCVLIGFVVLASGLAIGLCRRRDA